MELIRKKANYYLNIVRDVAKSKFHMIKNLSYEKWQVLAVIFLAIIMTISGIYFYFGSKPKLFEIADNEQNFLKAYEFISENENEKNKYFQEDGFETLEQNSSYDSNNEKNSLNSSNFFSENGYEELNNLKIVVHVCGEVKYPGVYYLQGGQRIYDAIQKAGGATEEADIHLLNLAQFLSDEERVYVPKKGEIISSNNFNINSISNQKININNADSSTLQKLSGIGPTLAQRIIDYRERNGRFKSIQQLLNVKGIGLSKFAEIEDKVRI